VAGALAAPTNTRASSASVASAVVIAGAGSEFNRRSGF